MTDPRIVGYRVYRATDGGAPAAVGSSFIGGWVDLNAELGHTYRYIITSYTADGIESAPSAAMVELGEYEAQGYPNSVSVAGAVAYLSDGGGGIQAVDVSQPLTPTLIGQYQTLGFTWQSVVTDRYLYAADGRNGLAIVERSAIGQSVTGATDSVNTSSVTAVAAMPPGRPRLDLARLDQLAAVAQRLATSQQASGPPSARATARAELSDQLLSGRSDLLRPARPAPADYIVRQIMIGSSRSGPKASAGFSGPRARPAKASIPKNYLNIYSSDAAATADCLVTTTADAGPGSLRWCLANVASGATVSFDAAIFPPSHPTTISIASQLPDLAQGGLTLDGSNAGVILDGSQAVDGTVGLVIVSDGNIVKGLQVVNFPASGILVAGGARYNVIGGSRLVGSGPLGAGNLFSGNGDSGVSIAKTGTMSNTVIGNFIGAGISGATVLGNGSGVMLGAGASRNVIGSLAPGERNIIAGSRESEVVLHGGETAGNVIIGNLIRTDPTGAVPLGDPPATWVDGVYLFNGAHDNVIGPGNVINNTSAGIRLYGAGVDGNAIIGNCIGTNLDGAAVLSTLNDGVRLEDSPQRNRIGGAGAGEGNTIAGCGEAGVSLFGGQTLSNTISANAIFDSGSRGILLAGGANGARAAPLLTAVTPTGASGTTCPGCTVEIFSDRAAEGAVYEGRVTATPTGAFTFVKTAGLAGPHVTATTTDAAGNTSEFSQPALLYTITHTVISPLDAGPGTLRQALLDAQVGDAITFDPAVFPPTRPVTIALASRLPDVTQGRLTIDASDAGVVLDGARLSADDYGLSLASDYNVVRGLQVLHFRFFGIGVFGSYNIIGGDRAQGHGPTGQGNLISANHSGVAIYGRNATHNAVLGNLIGTDVKGREALGNGLGVGLAGDAAENWIGGPTAGQRNIISGNFTAVQIIMGGTDRNTIAGNYIGTDVTGTRAVSNYDGIRIENDPADNLIGGTTLAERNLISGNTNAGVLLSGPHTAHNAIIGNVIGTDAAGIAAVPNGFGVGLYGVGFNRIGGTQPGEGNLISGNGAGIDVATGESTDVLVLGNRIGPDASGQRPLGNGIGIGFSVSTSHSAIGGATPAEGNIIGGGDIGVAISTAGAAHNWIVGNAIGSDATGALAFGNRQTGVIVEDYAGQTIVQGNRIAFNAASGPHKLAGVYIARALGNTLRRNSIFANYGPGIQLAQGGNADLPAPSIEHATKTDVLGTACAGCTVEIFSDAADEGRLYEGATVTNSAGRFVFAKNNPMAGPHITATATDDAGNTSAFSLSVPLRRPAYLPLIVKP